MYYNAVEKISVKYFLFLLVLLFSMFFLSYVPPLDFDLTRHYERFNGYYLSGYEEYINNYVGLAFLIKILVFFDLNAECMPLICSLIYFAAFAKYIEFVNGKSDSRNFNVWISFVSAIVICNFNYLAYMSGLRFSFAISFFIFAVLLNYKGNKILSWLSFLLSASFHFSLIIAIVLFYVSRFFYINNDKVRLFVLILAILFSYSHQHAQGFIEDLIATLPLSADIAYAARVYTFGEWGVSATDKLNVNGLAGYLLSKSITYVALLVYIYKSKKIYTADDNQRFVFLGVLYLCLTIAFYDLSGRFEDVIFLFALVPILERLLKLKQLFLFECFFLMVVMLRFFIDFFVYRVEYFRFFISPFLQITE